jgi:outer membrane protein assembly factor BamA
LKYLTDTIQEYPEIKSFGKVFIQVDGYTPVGKTITLNSGMSIGASTEDFITSDYFFVGGYNYNLRRNHVAFVGYKPGELTATNFAKIKISIRYRFYKNLELDVTGNGLVESDSFSNLITDLFELDHESVYAGYGGGITYKSPFGPISFFVAGNHKDSGLRWYINMGFTF